MKKEIKTEIMKTIKITKSDLDKDGFYIKEGIGDYDDIQDVNVEIAEGLGWVRFKKGIYVNGSVVAKAGSGIIVGESIRVGENLEVGWGIKAGQDIRAGGSIKVGEIIKADRSIKACRGIEAGFGIKAGWSIN